jgi:hypothetical protein
LACVVYTKPENESATKQKKAAGHLGRRRRKPQPPWRPSRQPRLKSWSCCPARSCPVPTIDAKEVDRKWSYGTRRQSLAVRARLPVQNAKWGRGGDSWWNGQRLACMEEQGQEDAQRGKASGSGGIMKKPNPQEFIHRLSRTSSQAISGCSRMRRGLVGDLLL